MKLSSSSSSSSLSKPISSPSREKFPPPLMRFLRTSLGSRSRPRSRPSPLFLRKKSTTNTNSATTLEPSSPKVTCIGQVRVRRSNNSKSTPKKNKNRFHYSHCNCNCGSISWKVFRMWVRVFCCGSVKVPTDSAQPSCMKTETGTENGNSPKFKGGFRCLDVPKYPNGDILGTENDNSWKLPCIIAAQDRSKSKSNRVEVEEETEDERETGIGFGVSVASASASTPPKNALLLTRCRSAPYRSSSLACRFLERETMEEERETEEASESEPRGGRDSVQEPRKGSIGNNEAIDEELKERPPLMMLKRCRSEPARKGSEELDPLTSKFWRERRRLSNTESCTPQSGD